MNPEIVTVNNVTKIFEVGDSKVFAVNDVSFTMNKGEFISIVGPSGSGKTTLLNLLGTLETPSGGLISIDGENITEYSTKELSHFRRRKIGFVFQFFNLIEGLTAWENIELPLVFDYQDPEIRKTKVDDLFTEFDLDHLKDKFPEELSSGERQRISIMRALVNEPALLLADEPTGNLDTNTGQSVLDLLAKLNESRETTILLVTHDLSAAKRAKRTIHMLDGSVEQDIINV